MQLLHVIAFSSFIFTCNGNEAMENNNIITSTVETDEARLHNHLFFRKRLTHPTHERLDVNFSLSIISIVDFDASSEALLIKAFLRQGWNNPKISWNPSDYGGVERINVNPDMIWVPDIYVYGNVEAQFKYNGLLDTLKTKVIIHYNGNHTWLSPMLLEIGCGMNVGDFPFDTQTCPVLFGSFTYDDSMLNLIPHHVYMKDYHNSSEWVLQPVVHRREAIIYPGVSTPFSDVKFTIVLQRKPLYVLLNLIAPTTILAFLSFLVFLQPVTTGERCVYVITILLALSWYVTSAIHYLPSSSEGVPLSQLFLGMSLSVMVLILFSLSYSVGTHYGNLTNSEIPLFLRRYVLQYLAPYFKQETNRRYPLWRQDLQIIKENAKYRNHIENGGTGEVKYKDSQFKRDETSNETNDCQENKNKLEDVFGVGFIKKISYRIDILLRKLEEDDDAEWKKREWNILALVIDKVLLYFFAALLVAEIIYCGIHMICRRNNAM